MPSNAYTAKFTVFDISTDDPPTPPDPLNWISVAEVTAVPTLTFSRDMVEDTSHGASIYRTSKPTLMGFIDLDFTLNFIGSTAFPADVGYYDFRGWVNSVEGASKWWRLVYGDNSYEYFEAYVKGVSIDNNLAEITTCTLSLRVQGESTFATV